MHDHQNDIGASPSWINQIALFQQWFPLVGYTQRWLAEPDGFARSIIIADACDWVCDKSKTTKDDEFVQLLEAAMKTAQGEALIRFLITLIPSEAK